jgi:MarR family transcriptional regulator, organic hydroperoxide resistance regulator
MDEQQGMATVLDAGPGPHAGHVREAGPVPHTEPLVAAGTDCPACDDDELNQQIIDTFGELIRHAHDVGQGIAAGFGLTVSDCKALFMLETPMTMKELGLKMGCDPSFVTSVADALEKHGLARREPSQRDRRSKNLVLTQEGMKVRDLVCGEISAKAPWSTTLDTGERRCLLGLMRKMLRFGDGR